MRGSEGPNVEFYEFWRSQPDFSLDVAENLKFLWAEQIVAKRLKIDAPFVIIPICWYFKAPNCAFQTNLLEFCICCPKGFDFFVLQKILSILQWDFEANRFSYELYLFMNEGNSAHFNFSWLILGNTKIITGKIQENMKVELKKNMTPVSAFWKCT